MAAPAQGDDLPASIFCADGGEVHDVPMAAIRRPLASSLERDKVEDFKAKLQSGVELTPIEVAWVEAPQGNYYFAFGGCHRWAAHAELHRETISARLIRVTPATIDLGASSPFRNTPPSTESSSQQQHQRVGQQAGGEPVLQ